MTKQPIAFDETGVRPCPNCTKKKFYERVIIYALVLGCATIAVFLFVIWYWALNGLSGSVIAASFITIAIVLIAAIVLAICGFDQRDCTHCSIHGY